MERKEKRKGINAPADLEVELIRRAMESRTLRLEGGVRFVGSCGV